MSPELVGIFAAISAENAKIEGMRAENAQRAALGHSMAYVADDFNYIADELSRLSINARNATP